MPSLSGISKTKSNSPLWIKSTIAGIVTAFFFFTFSSSELKAQQREYVVVGSALGISVMSVDPLSGIPNPVSGSPFSTAAQVIRITSDPLGRFLFAVLAGDHIGAYRIDSRTGVVTPAQSSAIRAGTFTNQVAVHPSGNFLYAANETSRDVNVYRIDQTTGSLTEIGGSPFPTSVSGYDITFSPSGDYAFIASNHGGLATMSVDPVTGTLAPTSFSPQPLGSNLTSVAVHPNGKYLYLSDALEGVIYSLQFTQGRLTQLAGSPYRSVGALPHWLVFNSAGNILYCAVSGGGSIAAFMVDPVLGTLNPILGSPFPTSLSPVSLALDATGRFAYATNEFFDNLSSFAIDQQTGAPAAIGIPQATGPYSYSVVVVRPQVQTGTISVITNLPPASFTIKGPASYTGGGDTFTQANALQGVYTITFDDKPCYTTPPPQTFTLTPGSLVTLRGDYQALTQLSVTVSPAAATSGGFSLSPPVPGMRLTGPFPITQNGLAAQSYTILFNPVAGFTTPPSVTRGPDASCTISFAGVYSSAIPKGTATLSIILNAPQGSVTISSVTDPTFTRLSTTGGSTTQLPSGRYQVTFSPITRYFTPAPQTVTLAPGAATTVNGFYQRLLLIAFTGFGNAPNKPSCFLPPPSFNSGSGVEYFSPQSGAGMTTLLPEIQGEPGVPALKPGLSAAAFTFYGNDRHGFLNGNACSPPIGNPDHLDAENWLAGKAVTVYDKVVVVGHSYGGNRARLFVEQIKRTQNIVADLLITVDPIEWTACNILNVVSSSDPLSQAAQACNQTSYTSRDIPPSSARSSYSFYQTLGLQGFAFIEGYTIPYSRTQQIPSDHLAIDDADSVHQQIRSLILNLVRLPTVSVTSASATRISSQLLIPITLSVTGIGNALSVGISSAALNGIPALNLSAKANLGDIAAGGAIQTTLAYPGNAALPGQPGVLTVTGYHTSGQAFYYSRRITIP